MTVKAGDAPPDAKRHLVPGLRLPAITLNSTDGKVVDLGKRPGRSIVYVYPWTGRPGIPNPPGWDDIPGAHGSTPQAEGFRDKYTGFLTSGWEVYGLSGQSTDWQREFADRLRLPFALLSDLGFSLADALQLPRIDAGGVAYLERMTLLVSDGTIVDTVYPVSSPATHAAELLDRLTASAGAAPV